MQYRSLVKQVQDYSGFSDKESETALITFVKTMAARLQSGERKDFASQLPEELKSEAMNVQDGIKGDRDDFFITFMENEDIQDESRAKKQIMAVWSAIKDSITPGQISHIREQMPKSLMSELR
jgi:uncharacterized protein (DUF2267 family)